jgi:membrane protein implicated in regulation of membrane protease activity
MTELPIDPEWLWLIGGVVLLIAELVAPGFSLVFIGAAAIATGLAALALPLSIPLQLALFAVLAIVIASVGGRRFYAARYDYSASPHLNDRVRQLLGRVVVVVEPVGSDGGRVRVGDSVWSARGAPAAVGDRVRIVDVEGNCLKVEPEHVLPPPA